MLSDKLDYFFTYSKKAKYVTKHLKPSDVPFDLGWIVRKGRGKPYIVWFESNSDYFKLQNEFGVEFIVGINGQRDYIMKDEAHLNGLLHDFQFILNR